MPFFPHCLPQQKCLNDGGADITERTAAIDIPDSGKSTSQMSLLLADGEQLRATVHGKELHLHVTASFTRDSERPGPHQVSNQKDPQHDQLHVSLEAFPSQELQELEW